MSKKEDILKNIEKESGPYLTTDVVDRVDALQAMDAWAKKQSVAMAEWMADQNKLGVSKQDGVYYWDGENDYPIDTGDLYDLFIQHQSQQP